ncbi:restriction endonuclease subunit S [Vibrio sp. FF112]|uniref:restriction endonuclease subunit S n=1 Tax=Vibrio sp. FF112 TaxID=3230008 RepID=UPI00352E4262
MSSHQVIPEGYKQTEAGIIPEDWSLVTLDDAANFLDGQRRPIKLGDRAKIKGQYPYYGASGIVDYVNNYIFDGDFILLGEDGENILSRSLPLAFKASGKIWVNNHAHVMTPKASFHIDFLIPYLESLDYSLLNSGTAQPKLNKQSCLRINVIKPSHEEQTAIANALSHVDALLSELEKLIAKKQAIKTATMQQLLTGKTRLPQFSIYVDGDKQGQIKGTKPSELGEIPEDWDVSTIDNISLLPMQNGLFYEPVRKGKGIPLINVSDMYTSAPIDVDSLELFDATEPEIKTFNVIEGDLFFTRSSIVPSGIAYCNVYSLASRVAVFDSHLIKVRVNPSIADYRFIYLNCLAAHARAHLVANAKTATMTTIDQKAIKSCPVLLPSIQEQTTIATILSDMDEEIQALQQRLSKTRQIKQGMMQELLTGKTRLPFDKVDTKSQGEPNAD